MTEKPDNQPLAGQPSIGTASIRALVLDDDPVVRRLMKLSLDSANCRTETAETAQAALQLLLQNNFDVMIVDLHIPGTDGLTFIEEAKKMWPWLGIVILTGFSDATAQERAAALGVTRILDKPIPPSELLEHVRAEAEEKRQRIERPMTGSFDQMRKQLEMLRQVSETVIEGDDLFESLRRLSDTLGKILPCDAVGVIGAQGDRDVLILSSRNAVSPRFLEKMQQEMIDRYAGLSGRNIHNENLHVEVEGPEADASAHDNVNSTFSVPILVNSRLRGVLTLASRESMAYTETDVCFLYHAANQLSSVLAAMTRVWQMAVRDPLTGLFNRRRFKESFDDFFRKAQAHQSAFSLMIVDLDHLKTINDLHGHAIGDTVICRLAGILHNTARETDIIGRYGGDEFILLLPGAGRRDAQAAGRRLLQAIRNHRFEANGHRLQLTASLGATTWTKHVQNADDMFEHADQALYAAKQAGRNRYFFWNDGALQQVEPADVILPVEPLGSPLYDQVTTRLLLFDTPEESYSIYALLDPQFFETTRVPTYEELEKKLTDHAHTFDIALLELSLLGDRAEDLLALMERQNATLVPIVMAHSASLKDAIGLLRCGAYDFLEKPVSRDPLQAALHRASTYRRLKMENTLYRFHLEDMVREKGAALERALEDLARSYEVTLETIVAMLDAREHATGEHSKRVKQMAVVLGRKMGLSTDALKSLGDGALLHDIGKVAIPDSVLLKPRELSAEERTLMEEHPQIGHDILAANDQMKPAAQIVLQHQERYDGSGYPQGLKGDDICLGARIFSVIDAYDAMRSRRIYKDPLPREQAVEEIRRGACTQFDAGVVDVFLECADDIEQAFLEYAASGPADGREENSD